MKQTQHKKKKKKLGVIYILTIYIWTAAAVHIFIPTYSVVRRSLHIII